MLLPSQPLPPVPDDTARIARAAFRRGNPYVLLRDKLGAVFADTDFADLYPKLGQPAYAPWRLALVTLMQFREGLSDRQAADAVRGRIDWKYVLALDLADAGFDFSVLCEFRGRLLQHGATERLLGRLLDAAREGGLLKARGRQRTDSTHVLAAVRTLNRLELVGETLRAALNAIAVAAPDWLRAVAPPEWHDRYDRRVEDMRLPEAGTKRDAYAAQVGTDGFVLLDTLDRAGTPPDVATLPEVAVLRRVWARHFERIEAAGDGGGTGVGARLRPVQGRGPADRVESPYDTEARFRSKRDTHWTGFCNGAVGVKPFLKASRRKVLASVRGQQRGRHIMRSVGADEPIYSAWSKPAVWPQPIQRLHPIRVPATGLCVRTALPRSGMPVCWRLIRPPLWRRMELCSNGTRFRQPTCDAARLPICGPRQPLPSGGPGAWPPPWPRL